MLFSRRILQLLPAVGHAIAQTPIQYEDRSRTFEILNQAREVLGVPVLAWSPDLATYAQLWANEMASGSVPFSHATGSYRPQQGENIYKQESSQYDSSYLSPMQSAARAWLAQAPLYDGTPVTTGTEPWLHFSQCMWKDTTQVGCASAYSISTPFTIFVVCRFFPEGNIVGQTPF